MPSTTSVVEQQLRNEIRRMHKRIVVLEAAVLAATHLLRPTTDDTEDAWKVLDEAYYHNTR